MQYRRSGGGMSARHLKVRDPQHLVDSPPRAPDAAPPATPLDYPAPAAPTSVAAVVMANSVEGAALQPSRQPAASEVEVMAGKEERRPSEPVPKKRRLLQAQDESQDILAKVISEVGIDDDSNLVEGEVEELPISGPGEGLVGLPYTKEVRPPPPGLSLQPRLRVADHRMRPAFPYQTVEGPYVMRGLRPPYPHYAPRPHDLIAQQRHPPQYRSVNAYPPRPYPRLPPPPPQALARLPLVRPSEQHLHPRHGSPTVPRHFRPPPLHSSPPGPPPMHQTHEVHHVFAAPSRLPLPGSSPESPTHIYPGAPLPRPELKDSHLREVYVPVLSLPSGPYANLHPRIPEGYTRLPFNPRPTPGREGAPHQVVVAPHLPPRPVYAPERLPGPEPAWRPQPSGDDAWRPTRRVIEPPAPCVELIPIGPLRSSTTTTPSSEDGRVSDLDNKPSGTPPTPEPRPQVGMECRRQSAPAQSDQCPRPPLTQRSLSSGPPFDDAVKAAPLVEARQVDGRVVTNIITGDRVYKGRHTPSKKIKRTTKPCEEEARPSSSNSDDNVEKEICIERDGDVATPQSGQPAACDDVGSPLSQPTRTCRPASEPPLVTMAPPVTGKRPASLPAAGTTSSVPCPRGEAQEDAAFTERLQLVLNDLVSVPGATQLQELSHSPARLLSTVLRRRGVQPSTHPDLQKRLREDFKTMVKLCMPPRLLQDFGWEFCTSEEILTQLIQLSQNGESERPSSMTSSIPPDEALDDDVFSPSTPHPPPLHPPPVASHPSQTPPPALQSSQPSPAAPQPSQTSPPAPQHSQPPPPVTQPSQPPPLAPQHSHPPPLAQQPSPAASQPSPPAPQHSHPPPLAPQPSPPAPQHSHPPPPAQQPSPAAPQPSPPAPQYSQPPPPAQHPSPPTSQPSQPPPLHSQPSQPTSAAPPPSHTSSTVIQSSQSPPSQHPTQPQSPNPQSPQLQRSVSQPLPPASVLHLSPLPVSKHLPLPSRPPHLSHSSPQPPYPPPRLQSPTPRPTHLPQHIFQSSHLPAHFTQPPTHHQTHTTQANHVQSPTSQPSHFPLVSRHSYPPQLTSQPLPLTSRPTPPPASRQGVPHSPQPTHLPPQIHQSAYHQSHPSRPPPLSLASPHPHPHSPLPSQTSPHSLHPIPHFPKADKAYSFQYHTQPYHRAPIPFRFTIPSQPQPRPSVRNAANTPPRSHENFHHHRHQQHQQEHHQQQQAVRFPSEKWIGGDDVQMPKVHNTANGQASPPNESLPT